MKFKKLDELELKHYLNEALNKCLEKEKVKLNGEALAYDVSLEQGYYTLLGEFEGHLKAIITTNKRFRK